MNDRLKLNGGQAVLLDPNDSSLSEAQVPRFSRRSDLLTKLLVTARLPFSELSHQFDGQAPPNYRRGALQAAERNVVLGVKDTVNLAAARLQ